MMKSRIYFFANFGEWDKQPYGGGEVGNRRTLELLKRMDYDICVIERYTKVPRNNIWNKFRFLVRVAKTVLKYTGVLLLGRRNNSLLHVVGFYGAMLNFDYLMVSLGKALGYRVIYEMRGGGADWFYKTMGEKYRQKFDNIIRKSDYVFSQGMENENLIRKIEPSKHIFYYPNYVMDEFYPSEYPEKPADRINLLYFGRISPKKNIDVVISSFAKLRNKYESMYLDIVGNYEDRAYFDRINGMIRAAGIEGYVHIHPACDHEQLKVYLRDKHIYIFPTKEPREGHSNAMTEAMAWGLVPVATAQGFNRSVLTNDDLIVEELEADSFANAIEKIIESGKIKDLSHSMYERVGELYTQERAFMRLEAEYAKLFNAINN